MYNLVYMAKPGYGGWVSFTTHLALTTNSPIHKITKRDEKNTRSFGYSCDYLNCTIDKIIGLPNLVITAIDKNYHQYLELLPAGTKLVIHDPTEVNGRNNALTKYLDKFEIITIRQTVQQYLDSKFSIKSTFKLHPFYTFPRSNSIEKKDFVSISRIDYDKHTEVLCKANEVLANKIKIYGAKNDRYVYQKLNELDSMKEDDPTSNYCGRFGKSFTDISNILARAKVVIDMSSIKQDGGGTQYSFLEAIYHNCLLVLNKKWVDGINSVFIDKQNCIIVSDYEELVTVLENLDNDTINGIIHNSQSILEKNIGENWEL